MPDDARWKRLEALFADALDRPEVDREAFVRAAAPGEPALADEVLALLAADARAARDWGDAAVDWGAPLLADTDYRTGDRIGAYVLDAPLGRGGMGTVWCAVRDDDTRLVVAIKVLRRGLDTADVRERFRQERRLLATLDHPGIARLLDAGVTPDGLPFVAMEYVAGEPIDAFCDRDTVAA